MKISLMGFMKCSETQTESWVKTGERFIFADKMAGECLEKSRVTKFTRIRDVSATELNGKMLRHPFHDLAGRRRNGTRNPSRVSRK